MAIEVGDKKRLAFVLGFIVLLGAAGYVWYPRLFSKRPPARVQQTAPPLFIEEPQRKPAPAPAPGKPKPKSAPKVAAKPPAGQAPAAREPGRAAPPAVRDGAQEAAPQGPAVARRYGLEFPPFVSMAEAEAYERRLKEAGLPTLRTVTDVDGHLYMLVIGPFPTAARATEALRDLGVKPGTPAEAEGGFAVNEGPHILREVVRRAAEIKTKGYGVKIVRAEGKAPLYIIRTAATLDTAQAQKLSSHYRSLGFPNSVVPSR